MRLEALLDHSKFVRDLAASLTFAHEDPDDVVQETWLAAVRNPPTDGPGVRGWLATVVRNALRQSRRSSGRRTAREAIAAAPEAVPSPDEIREREAVRREVVEAVLDLDEPYRTAVLLRYYEDLPPRKIAERTGEPVETVKTRLVRARGLLRKRLDDRQGGDGRTWGFAVAGLALWPGETRAPAPEVGGTLPWAKTAFVLVVAAVAGVIGVTVSSSPSGETPPERTAAMGDPDVVAAEGEAGEGAPPVVPAEEDAADEEASPETGDDPGGAGARTAKPVTAIEGTVYHQQTKKPVAGVTVRLVIESRPPPHHDTVTDEEGAYRFDMVPPGVQVRVFVRGRGRLVAVRGPIKAHLLESGETIRHDLEARSREGIDLRVILRAPEGRELPKEIRITSTFTAERDSSIELSDLPVDPQTGAVSLFLVKGTHSLVFESPELSGSLEPILVEGDGPEREVTLHLRVRGGLTLRLVDAAGRPLRRGPIAINVIKKVVSRSSMGSVDVSFESLGRHETDERGELNLLPILPALEKASDFIDGVAFAVESEGVFPGTIEFPNLEFSKKEINRLRRENGGGALTLDLPALPVLVIRTTVKNAEGEVVPGVQVEAEPAEFFEEKESVSDDAGRLEFRLLRPPPTDRRNVGRRVRLRLVARSPWMGEITLPNRPDFMPPGAQSGLVVSRPRVLSLRVVDDTGAPLARVAVKFDSFEATTDAEGRVRVSVSPTAEWLRVQAPGHLTAALGQKDLVEDAVVRLPRGREVVVSFRGPDGNGIVPVHAREKGYGRVCHIVRTDAAAKTVTILMPLTAVTVSVHPTHFAYTGSVVAEPGAREVELVYEKR